MGRCRIHDLETQSRIGRTSFYDTFPLIELEKPLDSLPPPFHYRRLSNGLDVVIVEYPHVPILVIGCYFRVGDYILDSFSMLKSLIVREAVFQGTQRFPTQEVIAMKLQQLGMGIRYINDDRGWGFFTYCPSYDYQDGMELVADLITVPLLDQKGIAKAMGIVEQTIQERWANQRTRLFATTYHYLYPANVPLQVPPLSGIMKQFSVQTIREFYDTYWRPDNALLVIGGNVHPENVWEDVERLWGRWPPADTPVFAQHPIPRFQPISHNVTFLQYSEVDRQATLIHAYAMPGIIDDPEGDEAIQILGELLNYPYGRFQRRMRDAGASYIRFEYNGSRFSRPASFVVMGLPEKMPSIIRVLREEIQQLVDDSTYFSTQEIKNARRRRGSYYSRSLANLTYFFGKGINRAWGIANVRYFFEYEQRIHRISKTLLYRKIRRYIGQGNWVEGLIMPSGALSDSLDQFFMNTRPIDWYQWRIEVFASGLPPKYEGEAKQLAALLHLNPDHVLYVHAVGPGGQGVATRIVQQLRNQVPTSLVGNIQLGNLRQHKRDDILITFSLEKK